MISTENINLVCASLMVEECVRKGADTFFLAPGSRCTPLTLAVARHPEAKIVQHFDERGLGFAALGFARATGRPGVVICTSGTAVSNLTPSVVEAYMSGCPILLLTADRPPELRDCGANQSIPQKDAFQSYVVFAHDLPSPEVSAPPQDLLTTLGAAFDAVWRGPVHLNCPFREPLAPVADETDTDAYLQPIQPWLTEGDCYTQTPPPVYDVEPLFLAGLQEIFSPSPRVLIIAGGGCREVDAMAILQVADQQKWPVISDVTSGLHFGPDHDQVVRHVDALTGPSGFPESLRPTHVIQFGTRFLSKPLLQALEADPPDSWVVVTPKEGRFDPNHQVSHRVQADIDRFCLAWHQQAMVPVEPGWKERWLDADAKVESMYHEQLDDAQSISEPGVARAVTRLIPNLHGLVLGASMPVRDVNQFAAPSPHRIHVTANRGASGIDGVMATAVGYAKGLAQPVTVLLGDLSALHDLNSLSLVAQSSVPVIVVVMNNRGGGIFHFLPVADSEPHFERFFGTPHSYGFRQAAEMFSIAYAHIGEGDSFSDSYQNALTSRTSWILEVETDRHDNVQLHKALAAPLDIHLESGWGHDA